MPYSEGHRLTFRWEVFNALNHQPLGNLDLTVGKDPFRASSARTGFGRFTNSQTPVGENRSGRIMQFALRYEF